MTTILIVLFWIAVVCMIVGAIYRDKKTWSAPLMWWATIVAMVIVGIEIGLLTALRSVVGH